MDEFQWYEMVTDIPARGVERTRMATQSECAAIADYLGIPSCERIEARWHIVPRGPDGYTMRGALDADLTQECVVTLEPVPAKLAFDFEVDFVVAPQASDGDEIDPFATTEVEPIENGRLAVGRILLEELATRLDPYPRHPDSKFEWRDEEAARDTGPFAELARLKQPKPDA